MCALSHASGFACTTICRAFVRYIEEIVKYVETIIEHGFAYAINGSVYFDTKAFR